MNEVLCKVVAHNLCVLIACIHEIGLEAPVFAEPRQIPALVAKGSSPAIRRLM
jgi:hypothetical protein